MDVETVKSFITHTDDKYRQSYGVSVESHPRSCIIVGATNSDGGFLRDITGNCRFWPVRVMGHGKYYAWELIEIDQIWAKAIERYKAHEELFLKGALAEEAVTQQRDAMESDDREGLVTEYIEVLLPEVWGNPHAGADKLAAQIDKLDILRERYSQAIEYMTWFEPGWSSLTDTEQHILSEFYMTDNQKFGATYRLMSELNYSESHIERLRSNALNHIRSKLFG